MRNLFLLLASTATLVACTSDSDRAGLSVQALHGATPTAADSGGTTYTLRRGVMALEHIELDMPLGVRCTDVADQLVGVRCDAADSPDDGEDKLRIDGPLTVDLVAGTSTPSLAGVVIPAGTYRRVDLRVVDFAIEADFDLHGAPTVLDLRTDFSEDIRVEQPGGVPVAPGDDLIARFALADWLVGVDLVACIDAGVTVTGGVAVVDDRGCPGVDDAIKRNMKDSGDLGDSSDDLGDDH